MRPEDMIERQLADWLSDGPIEAPGQTLEAAVAHARAHPRRRSRLTGPWRAAMTRLNVTEVAPRPTHRFSLAVVVVATAVVAAVGVGGAYLIANRPTNGGPPVAAPTGAAAPGPSAAEYVVTAPNGTTVDDLAGTWTGIGWAPAGTNGQGTGGAYDQQLTLPEGCLIGGLCGRDISSQPGQTWDYAWTYLGYRPDLDAFIFAESSRPCPSGDACPPEHLVALTPLPGGATLGFMVSTGSTDEPWYWYGILRRQTP